MKTKVINFVRGLRNGTLPRFQSYFKSILMVVALLSLSSNVWGADVTYTWTFPFSTTKTNADLADDNSRGATMGAYTSKNAINAGSWTNITNGSYFGLNSHFLIKVPITSSTTSFTLDANIFAWKSSKYAAKNVTITYYTSKNATIANICSGATTTSGCYGVSEEITLPNSYVVASTGTLFIKIAMDAGNDGFEALSVTTKSGSTKADVTLTSTQNARNVMVDDIVEDLSTWYTVSPAAYDGTITYTSSDEDVFAEDEGAGYALSAGTCNLYINAPETSNYKAANCTISVTVSAPAEKHNVNWHVGTEVTTDEVAEGASITFPSTPSVPDDCEGKSFFGWAKSAIDGETDDAPTIYTSGAMGTADIDFYAVFAEAGSGGTTENTVDICSIARATIAAQETPATVTLGETAYQIEETPISLTATKGTNNWPVLNYHNANGVNLRFYKATSTVTFTAASPAKIRRIEFLNNAETPSNMANISATGLSDNVWSSVSGESSVTFTYSNSDGNYTTEMWIINVTYTTSGGTTYSGFVTTCKACESEVAVTKAACENGSFTVSKETVCADDAGGSVTVTCTPDEHYHVSAVTATVGSVTGSGNSYTVSGITAATEIAVTFAIDQQITVTWNVNGTETPQLLWPGEHVTALPEAPTVMPICANTFMGWSTSTLVGEGHNAPTDLFNKIEDLPEITGDVTFNAVFATAVGGGTVTHTMDVPQGAAISGYAARSFPDDQGYTWSGTFSGFDNGGEKFWSLSKNAGNYHISSPTFAGNVSSIKLWVRQTADDTRSIILRSNTSSAQPTESDMGLTAAVSYSADVQEVTITPTTQEFTQFNIYVSNGFGFRKIQVVTGGGVTYSNYVTSCATYTVTWMSNGYQVREDTEVAPGTVLTAPTVSEVRGISAKAACNDYLVGWMPAESTTNPKYTSPDTAPTGMIGQQVTVTDNVVYHAVYADVEEE